MKSIIFRVRRRCIRSYYIMCALRPTPSRLAGDENDQDFFFSYIYIYIPDAVYLPRIYMINKLLVGGPGAGKGAIIIINFRLCVRR